MSVPVELQSVPELVASLGPEALLVTVTPAATPHVVAVTVTSERECLRAGAGRRTAANLAANAACTLVFPAVRDDAFRLIVDGTATVRDDVVVIVPSGAILHRVAR
ncbi:MAG: pyridoxamine 5'-phosphate oxidase [Acidimicrobiia bacterium]